MTDYAIEIEQLSKTYHTGFFHKSHKALDNLSLKVKRGEILGYLGPNGSGKTTTFKLMLGLARKDSGSIKIFGKTSDTVEYRAQIGYLPENPYFYHFINGHEFLTFHGGLYGIKRNLLEKRIEELLDKVGLSYAKNIKLGKYSRGMLQRIGIAQALINDPSLLILDEPMSGLDPFGRKEMRDLIVECKNMGKTVIFSSHILSDVENLCDKAAIIMHGHLKDVVNVNDILNRKISYHEITCKDISNQHIENYRSECTDIVRTGNITLFKIRKRQRAEQLLSELSKREGCLISYTPHRDSLEDIFVKYGR